MGHFTRNHAQRFALVRRRDRLSALYEELVRRRPLVGEGLDRRTADPALPFERLGPFRLLRQLDQGGMGTVFLAEQEPLGRVVALKVIRADLRSSEAAVARFDREVQTLAKLRHPNVVTVHGAGHEQGIRFLAMEYIEGKDFDRVLDEARAEGRPLPANRMVRWGRSHYVLPLQLDQTEFLKQANIVGE